MSSWRCGEKLFAFGLGGHLVAIGEGVGTLLMNSMKALCIMRVALPLLESLERPSNANIVRARAGWACGCHGGGGGDAYGM